MNYAANDACTFEPNAVKLLEVNENCFNIWSCSLFGMHFNLLSETI